MSAESAIQKGVIDALAADGQITSAVNGVYQHIPQEEDFPYIRVRVGVSENWLTATTSGKKITLVISVFFKTRSSKPVLDVLERIHALLHDQDITLSGATLVNMRFLENEVDILRDGLTYEGTSLFLATVEE
jgi:hypothetical protein